MQRRFPLHIHISTLFLVLILLVGALVGGLGYQLSRDLLNEQGEDLTRRVTGQTLGELGHLVAPAEMAVRLLEYDAITSSTSVSQRWARLGMLREALSNSSALSSLYIAYANGDFFFMRRLRDAAERQSLGAPATALYMVQSIERGVSPPQGRYDYLDADLQLLRSEERPDYPARYDPRERPWYRAAQTSQQPVMVAPYVFYSNQKVGTTIAARASTGGAVIGADILLETLSASLAEQKLTPNSHLALVDGQGYVLASDLSPKLLTQGRSANGQVGLTRLENFSVPVLATLAAPVKAMRRGDQYVWRMHGAEWRATITPLQLRGAPALYLVMAIPDAELLAAALHLRMVVMWAVVLVLLLTLPLTWGLARGITRPLRELLAEAEAIRHFDFSRDIRIRSLVSEVHELGLTMDGMKHTIRRFLDISLEVAAEQNFDRLLPYLLAETLSAAEAGAGVLYLADEQTLKPVAGQTVDGQVFTLSLPSLPAKAAGPLLQQALVARSSHVATLLSADLQLLGLPEMASRARQAIAIPLRNRDGQLVGVMLLLREQAIDAARLRFVEALAASAAVSLENKELIQAQKALFQSLVRLIAGAIDAKSPYTGGHCARVPELTKMLARAACKEQSGPFQGFQLDEGGWEALHVAAWLHDCGKITTPEYVVDKSTKLETLYDRIHEVRMRFEVLKRDARIHCLETMLGGGDDGSAQARLQAELAALDDDFAFVANCNTGGEFMSREQQQRLRDIGARRWLRTLDDRIGIAHEELQRKARSPAPTLPVSEPLLADKAEHIFERGPADTIPADNPWGFRMAVPERLYNRGELYNLCVERGTLSEEERFKINEHIVQTIIMLSQLSFPKHLRQVPEIAGGHHEKMDGSGYPKRLKREEMSTMARMLAIADIFEALTAVDRPYKKGKTLSEAIKIMVDMRDHQHVDAELFDLFLRSGVYRDYAERFMRPELIDSVDIAAYLSPMRA